MKVESIRDIDKLPSVLDIEEVSLRLVELVEVIRKKGIDPVEGAEAINELIYSQGYNETGLSLQTSRVVLQWIKDTYDPSNNELIEFNSANLANLTCREAKDLIEDRLNSEISEFERKELEESLREINVRS